MGANYQKQWEEYNKLTFDERKTLAISILESFRGQGETFDLVYDYLTRGENITDQDLQDVYQSLMKTAYEIDKSKEIAALEQLESLRAKGVLLREEEEKEKREAEVEARNMLIGMV